jgi:Cu(I)/Ag(I) efflux system membrane protein CusA/SilA
MLGTGTGSDVMQRIAAPMVGGMLTTTLLCLLVLPVIYGFALHWKESRRPGITPEIDVGQLSES